jgi:hypothetical protein
MLLLATAHAQSGIVAGLKILLISGLIAAIGAIVPFDPFGLVSKYRFPPRVAGKIWEAGRRETRRRDVPVRWRCDFHRYIGR